MSRIGQFFSDAETKLDEYGRGAWIATMVLGFILFWPLGLLTLGYMIWSGRMSCSKSKRSFWHKPRNTAANTTGSTTGNTAFDAYREETLRRLESEQSSFEAFLGKLRLAKDKAEFEQFMDENRSNAGPVQSAG